MVHIRTTISITEDVYNHVKRQEERYGFKLSRWVEESYRKTIMSSERLLEDIERTKVAVAQMEHDYEVLRSLEETRIVTLSKSEKRWITSELLGRLERSNNNWDKITEVFNLSFGRSFNKNEFKTMSSEVLDEQRPATNENGQIRVHNRC